MHSERAVSQQQELSPISSSSTSPVPISASKQSIMLSAGQPAVPSSIFRTGEECASPSQRFTASGGYVHGQYPSVYGIQGQFQGNMTTIQPYSTYFPGFALGHRFIQGSLMPGAVQAHYPQIESYSAMLASMGSQAQHRGTQAADRTPRVPAAVLPVSQHLNPFLPATAHLSSVGGQYPNIQSPSHHHHSDIRSPSPVPATVPHTLTSTNKLQDILSSRHLQKLASIQGVSPQPGRDEQVSREIKLYGKSASLNEDTPVLSTGSYSASAHVPKVSFDTVVKEYGESRDCPTGGGDVCMRSTLCGKEGSLKHRILTRPSDSDMPAQRSRVNVLHALKDEPLSKRPKVANYSSAGSNYGSTDVTYGVQFSPAHQNDSQRSSNHHLPETLAASHHSVSKNNNSVDSNCSSNQLENTLSKHPSVQHQHHSKDNDRYNIQQGHLSPSLTPPTTSTSSEDHQSHVQYPSHFLKGSIIQLANGSLKRVEELQTEDFVNSAEISLDLKVDNSTVVKIEENTDSGTAMLSFSVGEQRIQVTVEATLEHPFFVFGQGWSSCSVSRTLARYGLDCQKLNVGDVCISLTHKDVSLRASAPVEKLQQTNSADPPVPVTSSTETSHLKRTLSSSPSSSLPVCTSSVLLSTLKLERADSNILPPSSVDKRRLSQTELPPPSSNIVLVKKENNNNCRRRDLHRVEAELKEELLEEEDDSASALSACRKRCLPPDLDSAKAAQEENKDRQITEAIRGHTKEETLHTISSSSSNSQL